MLSSPDPEGNVLVHSTAREAGHGAIVAKLEVGPERLRECSCVSRLSSLRDGVVLGGVASGQGKLWSRTEQMSFS